MDTRKIIDYAQDGNAVGVRESLYASIWDRVHAAIEAKKQEIAQTLVAQESYEGSGDDEEDEYVASVRKNMAKRDAEKAAKQTAKTANKQLPGGSRASDKLAKESYEGPGDDEEDDWDEEDEQIDEAAINHEEAEEHYKKHVLPLYHKHGLSPKFASAVDAHVQKYGSHQVWNHHSADGASMPSWFDGMKNKVKPLKQAYVHERIDEESLNELSPSTIHNFKVGRKEKLKDLDYDPHLSVKDYDKQAKKTRQGIKLANRRLTAQGQSTKTPSWLRSESYDDDEDPDVRIADKELKKRGVTLPKVKVDPDKDMAKLAKRTPKEKEED